MTHIPFTNLEVKKAETSLCLGDISRTYESNLCCRTVFVTSKTIALYNKIFYKILQEVIFEDESKVDRSLFYNSGTADETTRFGLIYYIVQAYVSNALYVLEIEKLPTVNGKQINQLKRLTSTKAEENQIEIRFINNNEPLLINSYYNQLFGLQASIEVAQLIANTPLFKVAELRNAVKNKETPFIKTKVNALTEAFEKPNGMVTIDAGDTFDFASIDVTSFVQIRDMILGDIVETTNLPKSFVSMQKDASLGDSGEADQKQLLFGLNRYFHETFKSVVEDLFQTEVTFPMLDFDKKNSALDLLTKEIAILDQIDSLGSVDAEKKTQVLNLLTDNLIEKLEKL